MGEENKGGNWVHILGIIAIAVIVLFVIFLMLEQNKKTEKVYHIGILAEVETMNDITNGFKTKMAEMGYIEGKNIVYNYNLANFNSSEEKKIIQKFINEKVDLIFAYPTEAVVASKANTKETGIPIVFAQSMIEGNNLVDSQRQPGGDITGVRDPGPDITIKRLEILHKLVPKAKRVYIPYDSNFPAIPPVLKALRPEALLLGIELIELEAKSKADIQSDLNSRNLSWNIGIDAILTLGQPLTSNPDNFALLSAFTVEHNIPIGGIKQNNNTNNLFIFTPKFNEIGFLAAQLADKILKGASAGSMPVVTPEAYLTINSRRAKELGINISEGLLSQAEEIIK